MDEGRSIVEKKLNLPAGTTSASRPLTINGKTLGFIPEIGQKITEDSCYYQNEIELKYDVENDYYSYSSFTVENNCYARNSFCFFKPNGSLISGKVNCFALGTIDMDQDYLDEIFEEMSEFEWQKTDSWRNTLLKQLNDKEQGLLNKVEKDDINKRRWIQEEIDELRKELFK
jgi:hypothetical protein